MLRCRIWNERSSAYVCAFCSHPALPRQRELGYRSYSDTSSPSSNGGNRSGGWGSWGAKTGTDTNRSSAIPGPASPVNNSEWGKPSFGGAVPSGTTNVSPASGTNARTSSSMQSDAALDGLLPHEMAARKRLQKPAPKPTQPEPAKVLPNAERLAATQSRSPNVIQRRSGLGIAGLGSTFLRVSPQPHPDRHSTAAGIGKDKPEARLGKGASSSGSDWRHRGLDRNSLPGSDRKLQSTPIPHHRHTANAVKEELGMRQRPETSQQQKIGLGQSEEKKLDDGKPLEWGLLRKKTDQNSRGVDDSSIDNRELGGWGSLARKPDQNRRGIDESPIGNGKPSIWSSLARKPNNGPTTDSTMSKEDFLIKFQQHMGSKHSDRPKEPHAALADGAHVENIVQRLQDFDEGDQQRNGKREFDDSYEIDRDPRKRDKGGYRRGGPPGSYRGTKKSAAQQRWEEQNEVWDAKSADRRRQKAEEKARRKALAESALPQAIFLPEFISVANLGVALKLKPQDFLIALGEMGFEDITEESIMTGETASLVAMEFGFEPTVDTGGARDLKPRPPPEDPSILPPRPPVVTIMGHVDHGKTTLLDYLRKSSVAAQEHGGITQHIGAFRVKMSSGKLITFLDTPGHAAFLTMRQRGANVTDIVVLVVAADDSVKPQTLEALKHARSAKVPIIVAINKVDKEDARPDQVKADLARHGVEIEDFGGDVQVVCVSGKTGQGMDELEENIVALAEIQDMRAEDNGMAEAWVLEASVKPWGKSANMLVKRGTLHPGDCIVAGTTWARIRVLRDEAGQELEEAPPGTPVEVLGWREELPAAGDEVLQAPDEDRARTAVDYREEMREREASSKQLAEQEQREREAKAAAEAGATEGDGSEDTTAKTVNFAVRGDVVGSVEAVCATINEIGNNEVMPRILWSAAGQVSETDVEHAAASNSAIVNFNSPVHGHIKRLAEEKGVRILDHTVIYHLADDVKRVMSEKLADKVSHKVLGEADIIQVFPINIKGRVYKNIAGCKVRNGLVKRSTMVRILRKGEKIFDGKIETLKHGKKDVTEIRKGSECGISFDGFTDFMAGDQIQTYEEVREKRNL